MKVLHLTSDWKWTGPAAPMLELILGLRDRGHDVELVCPESPEPRRDSLSLRARAAGVVPAWSLTRGRRGWAWRDGADARRLQRWLARGGHRLVHTWHTRDHLLALRSTSARRRAEITGVVRSYRRADPIARRPWNHWLFGSGADGLLCVSPRAAERNARLRGGRPLLGAFGAVDLARFTPAPPDPRVRERLGLRAQDRVLGVVARVQPQRRFDLLLEAMRRLAARDPDARLLIVGRGTRLRELAEQPAARLGLSDRVVFAGYRTDDYPAVLRSIDLLTYLAPGSDGGCRALLEAAACGIPAVVTRRGALPELVVDGETGLLAEEHPAALAAAWAGLFDDPTRRAALGGAARGRAEAHFSRAGLAERVETLYQQIVDSW